MIGVKMLIGLSQGYSTKIGDEVQRCFRAQTTSSNQLFNIFVLETKLFHFYPTYVWHLVIQSLPITDRLFLSQVDPPSNVCFVETTVWEQIHVSPSIQELSML